MEKDTDLIICLKNTLADLRDTVLDKVIREISDIFSGMDGPMLFGVRNFMASGGEKLVTQIPNDSQFYCYSLKDTYNKFFEFLDQTISLDTPERRLLSSDEGNFSIFGEMLSDGFSDTYDSFMVGETTTLFGAIIESKSDNGFVSVFELLWIPIQSSVAKNDINVIDIDTDSLS